MKPLFHHQSSSNIIFFYYSVALLMISIMNIPTCICKDDPLYTNCNTAFDCESSVPNLKYPFWGENRAKYCGGDSNTEVTCEGKVPKITIKNVKYRILDWENTTKKLTVAREDYSSGDVCAVNNNYSNSTFDNTGQFQRFSGVSNVTLLYNCVPNGDPSNMFHSVDCHNTKFVVYTVVDPTLYSTICSPSVIVVIPILDTFTSQLASGSGLDDALEKGFELRWNVNSSECDRCVGSGGLCGNDGGTGFRCFCKDVPYKDMCNSEKASTSSASLAGFGITTFFIVMITCHLKRGIHNQKSTIVWKRRKFVENNVEVFMRSYNLSATRRYSYTEIKKITNSFRNKLGQGGYGIVYKANLPDGRHVAVKVINEYKGNGEEFINEVASISRTSHTNIVSLLGFCYEMNKRVLLYEYMPNGSLDKFIYKSGFTDAICDFNWNKLFQIAIGIARGLEYLHQGCTSKILHLDIKPQNILLDEDFCPKISDFGLAKICQKKESIVSIPGTRGTIGYMAPEVFSRAFGGISHKSDVYSYGMLILEMIGGRKNYDTGGSCTSEMYFPDWIYKDLDKGNNTLLNGLTISEEENDMVRKITLVSLWCIQTNPLDRPPINKVIEMLHGPLSSVSSPPKPVLFSPERPPLQLSCMSSSSLDETNSITVSK